MKKILYLPVETVVRDLDANIFLGYEAMKRGYPVVIGSLEGSDKYARYQDGGIMITKHWEKSFPYDFHDPNREKFIYIGFHPEGLVFKDRFFGEKMNVTGKSEKLDINFVYGNYQKKLLEEVNPKLSPVLKPVGHPRFDLLRKEFHYLYSKNVNRLQKKHGPFILINTNFTSGNTAGFYDAGYIERKNRESIRKWGKPLDEDEILFLKDRISYYKKLLIAYLEMLRKLPGSYPGTRFILRPHPSENHDIYHRELGDIDNLKVIHEGSVIDWILASKGVIQTGCTTAIETWACRQPLIRFNPFDEAERFESSLPNRFGRHETTIAGLVNAVQAVLSGVGGDQFEEQMESARPYIESIDGERSASRMMNEIDRVLEQHPNGEAFSLKTPLAEPKGLQGKKEDFIYELLRTVRRTHWLMKWRHGEEGASLKAARYQKNPGIRKRYLKGYLSNLAKSDPTVNLSALKILKVERDTFLLSLGDPAQPMSVRGGGNS